MSVRGLCVLGGRRCTVRYISFPVASGDPHPPKIPNPIHAAAVKYALRKMRAQVEAEAKKRQKQTQLTSGDKANAVSGQTRAKRARNA